MGAVRLAPKLRTGLTWLCSTNRSLDMWFAPAVSAILGKRAALASATRLNAEATFFCAAITSGLRSSNSEGSPAGTGGGIAGHRAARLRPPLQGSVRAVFPARVMPARNPMQAGAPHHGTNRYSLAPASGRTRRLCQRASGHRQASTIVPKNGRSLGQVRAAIALPPQGSSSSRPSRQSTGAHIRRRTQPLGIAAIPPRALSERVPRCRVPSRRTTQPH